MQERSEQAHFENKRAFLAYNKINDIRTGQHLLRPASCK